MTTAKKNPGLGAVRQAAQAAQLAVGKDISPVPAKEEKAPIKGVGIRMSVELHEQLRRISFEQRVPLNDLLVEGAKMVVASRSNG